MIRSILIAGMLVLSVAAFSAKDGTKHDHGAEGHAGEEKAAEEKGHDHGAEEEGHEHEESAGNVGPDKGILEVSERFGFKLSPEALKNFDLQFQKLSGDGPWIISRTALVHAGEEVNVFRRRNGFFKRIDFQEQKKGGATATIDSDDLRVGDEVVTSGLGFLRIAEVASSGGIAHGHSH